ncbi:MAG: dimethylsulfoniopropionate demethylase [Alphaproteobacteria bacterium]
MTQAFITPSRRVRITPWYNQVMAAGAKAFTVYNHMLLPTQFFGAREDYDHLSEHVQVWDVACERQVQLKGPDALDLLQLMTPRDMAQMADDRCFYIPLVDGTGHLLNDPVVMKVGEDIYWVSIASSDVALYAKGLVAGRDMRVEITEPDINPLAIQGPKSDELMVRVFGEEVRSIKFFRFKWLAYQGVDLLVARTGFSGRGGFEIYVPGPSYENGAYPVLAINLWDELFDRGEDLSVAPGCPNWIDFMEAGLLSYGNTIDSGHTPFEAGLGKYCNGIDTCLASEALSKEADEGPARMVRGVIFDSDDFVPSVLKDWSILDSTGKKIGLLSAASPSPHVGTHIGMGTIEKSHWQSGTFVSVETPEGLRTATVTDLPFR